MMRPNWFWSMCLLCLRAWSVYWTFTVFCMLVDFGSMYAHREPPFHVRVLQLLTPLLTAIAVAAIATIGDGRKWPKSWCIILIAQQVLFSLFWPPWL